MGVHKVVVGQADNIAVVSAENIFSRDRVSIQNYHTGITPYGVMPSHLEGKVAILYCFLHRSNTE